MAKDLVGNPISAEAVFVHSKLFVETKKGKKKYFVQFSADVERPEGEMLESFKLGCNSEDEAVKTRDEMIERVKKHGKVLMLSMVGFPQYKGL